MVSILGWVSLEVIFFKIPVASSQQIQPNWGKEAYGNDRNLIQAYHFISDVVVVIYEQAHKEE